MSVRIGIDVGGTFTDVVAVDTATRALVASVKVPTTHDHPDGVAAGIVAGLARLLRESGIEPASVAFIAHSTTQATNALLEGDVATVGVACYGSAFARAAMRFEPIALGGGNVLSARFFTPGADVARTLDAMAAAGVGAFVASAAFGVDRPEREGAFVERARERGLAATCGSEVSAMYGLRARTRTAALNAAILPRMLRTARVTRDAVAAARIPAPLMIMRSDGGVMDVAEVERRPILTMLSGPAAGIAGALFHENVTDGIFIEVGGTSADCSVIRRGRPQIRPARIGGHRTLLYTLDVRTLAVAGGSLVHAVPGRVTAVGPRSAHIAGYRYAAFCDAATIAAARPVLDGGIAALSGADGPIALTPTCAANALDRVPEGAFARGDRAAALLACETVGAALGMTGPALARRDPRSCDRAAPRGDRRADRRLRTRSHRRRADRRRRRRGGARAVCRGGARLRTSHRARCRGDLAARGRARARARRRRADDRRPRAGRPRTHPARGDRRGDPFRRRARTDRGDRRRRSRAQPRACDGVGSDRARRGRDRARARGRTRTLGAAARALREERAALRIAARTPAFLIVAGARALALVDERGVVRLTAPRGVAYATTAGGLEAVLAAALEEQTAYGDVGRAPPDLWLVAGARTIELSGIAAAADAAALVRDEVAGLPADTALALIAIPKRG